MRLGYKSKLLLETLVTAGVDALRTCAYPKSLLMDVGGWEEEKYASRQLKKMQQEGWIIWDDSRETGAWVVRLTEAGLDAVATDIDPEKSWAREWDGKWRVVGFDLPVSKRVLRRRLHDWLHANRFGCLQGSLWVTPLLVEGWETELKDLKIDPSAVSFFQGHPFSWSKDSEIVKKAWNFKEINRLYQDLIDIRTAKESKSSGRAFNSWIRSDNAVLKEVMAKDPFLPKELLPKGYLGMRALNRRSDFFSSLFGSRS